MNILFLSGWYPYPTDNGSKIRIYNLLKGLSQHHSVTLLSFTTHQPAPEHLEKVRTFCRKVVVVPLKEFSPSSLKALVAFFDIRPRSIVDTYSLRMQEVIKQELGTGRIYDLIIASEMTTAMYYRSFTGIPALLEDVELQANYDRFSKATNRVQKTRWMLGWLKNKRYLARSLTKFTAATVVSERELDLLSSFAPKGLPVYLMPNCIDVDSYKDVQVEPEQRTLIFTGALTYSANYEAVCYFLRDVYPLLKQSIPELCFRMIGNMGNCQIPNDLLVEGVQQVGYVDDVRPWIARSWVSVVPLKHGGGTRLKILEAMALGTPVVSTSKGAEGLQANDGEHLMIADTPEEFAAATIRLNKDPELRNRLSENGRKLVETHYNWKTTLPRFLDIIEHLPMPMVEK